jgi:hypothetical protein
MASVKLSSFVAQSGILSVVFGISGKGKTSCIRNFPADKTAIITSEPGGLQSLVKFGWDNAKVWCPTCPADYLKAVEEILQDKTIDHIVLDTASQYYEQLIKNYIDNFDKDLSKLGMDLYRVSNLKFQEMFRTLFAATELGKDVVCLVHLTYREHEENEQKKVYKEPALPGQLPGWISRQAALVLRCENVKMGTDVKYFFTVDCGDGAYGKDLYSVVNGSRDNDLWALYQKIKKVNQPNVVAETPVTKERDAAQLVYKEMVGWGMDNGVNSKLINEFITQQGLSVKTSAYDSLIACFRKLKEKFELERSASNA